jgi:hypothetical protein
MNEPNAFCPGCKTEAVFGNVGGARQCLSCGYQFPVSGAPPSIGLTAWSGVEETFRILFKAFLIMLAIAIVGLAVAFAGCALMLGR